ncbi:MAG TPA: Rieske 2Fe-2S domain-containing protein [Gemmatimonadaceae bacterium]|jgi:cytochrome b6-f complex iron-sulfur subunit|nr:Rieske 2Fe-2S domain-containing protein [Gemmatimonadaceae bacterium]
MSCHDCLSRREFLTKSTLAVAGAAAVVAGCGDGQIGPTAAPSLSGSITLKVSTVPALATVGQLVIHPADGSVALKRTGANTFLALSTTCTHEGTRIDLLGNNSFECPNHGSRFDADGNVTRQPNAAGNASHLLVYSTQYDAATDILTVSALPTRFVALG